MSKSFKATWLGDSDPNSQVIWVGGLRFVKGDAVDVPADNEFADRIHGNPTFAVDKAKADVVPVDEPTEEEQQGRAEEGTEKGALKARLKALGVETKGNPSVETLRTKLADATKDMAEMPALGMPGNALGR